DVQGVGRILEVRSHSLEPLGRVVTLGDVTAVRRAEDVQRETNDRFSALLVSAPVAIVLTDLERRIQLWNQAAESLFGWGRDEVLGERYDLLVPGSERAHFQELFSTVIGGTGISGVTVTRSRRDGTPIPVAVSAAPARDARGNVVGA